MILAKLKHELFLGGGRGVIAWVLSFWHWIRIHIRRRKTMVPPYLLFPCRTGVPELSQLFSNYPSHLFVTHICKVGFLTYLQCVTSMAMLVTARGFMKHGGVFPQALVSPQQSLVLSPSLSMWCSSSCLCGAALHEEHSSLQSPSVHSLHCWLPLRWYTVTSTDRCSLERQRDQDYFLRRPWGRGRDRNNCSIYVPLRTLVRCLHPGLGKRHILSQKWMSAFNPLDHSVSVIPSHGIN